MRRELVHLLNRDETSDALTEAVLRRFWKVGGPPRIGATTSPEAGACVIDLATRARAMRSGRP